MCYTDRRQVKYHNDAYDTIESLPDEMKQDKDVVLKRVQMIYIFYTKLSMKWIQWILKKSVLNSKMDQILLAELQDREEIKNFHTKNHLELSSDPNERISQEKDLPEDFPVLFHDEEFLKRKIWIIRDQETKQLVGCIGLLLQGNVATIELFSVQKQRRGQGFGKMLLEKALQEAKQLGAVEAKLVTCPQIMQRANQLYTAAGFVKTNSRKGHIYIIETMTKAL